LFSALLLATGWNLVNKGFHCWQNGWQKVTLAMQSGRPTWQNGFM